MKTSSYLLKAGVDYPTNWDEFVDWLHDEQSCTSYLYALRWPNGFICPSCSSHQFIQDVIEPGSTICSDDSQAYKQIDKKGYKHNRIVHLGSSVPAHETMAGYIESHHYVKDGF